MSPASRHSLGGRVRVGWGGRGGSNLFAVEQDTLTLRCFRTYSFTPGQIVSIERLPSFWLDAGVRIVHNREDYPRTMQFVCRDGSDAVFELLALAAFVPCGSGPAGRSRLRVAAGLLVPALALQAISSMLWQLWKAWRP